MLTINNHTVNIDELRKQYSKEYEFLYEHDGNAYVAGTHEAMAFGDEVIRLRPDLVHAFCDGRTVFDTENGPVAIFDPLTSDREVAAFGFALNELYGD